MPDQVTLANLFDLALFTFDVAMVLLLGVVSLFFPKRFQEFYCRYWDRRPISKRRTLRALNDLQKQYARSSLFVANTRFFGMIVLPCAGFLVWMLIKEWRSFF